MEMDDAGVDFYPGEKQKSSSRLNFGDTVHRIAPVRVYDRHGNLKRVHSTEELEEREVKKNQMRYKLSKITHSEV